MLEKYIDKLMPIIATVMWVGGMGYIVMNLYTCFNEDEVQEVIIPKTIDEKIDIYAERLPVLEDDTDDIIEYAEQSKNKKRKKFNFWKLLETNE